MKSFECFVLDPANQCLLRKGACPQQIDLPPKPFAVLCYLVEHPGRLITHDELLDALWPETYVQPQVLRTYMLDLRKALGDDAAQPRFIQTVPKRGYRFVAQVTERVESNVVPAIETQSPNASDAALVGRTEELARLKAHMQRAAVGERQVVFVTGEAGIGKTALVDAFCRQLAALSAGMSARGQCVQGLGGREEYYPVIEALRELCVSPEGEKACQVLARLAPAWLSAGQEGSAARPTGRERMLGDLCAALDELAVESPLVLVFEDLHWADEPTLHLISALARRRSNTKLMVIATYTPRSGQIEDARFGLKQDLLIRRLSAEIVLAPLRRTAVRELIGRELGQEKLPQDLADFVFQRSEGNPLFVLAVLEHLMAQGVLMHRGMGGTGSWEQCAPLPEMEAGVPDQLARMIEQEIGLLGEEEQRLLEAASLMSVAFPAWAVAAALDKDPMETEEACDSLARRLHFVVRAGQDELPDGTRSAFYVFAHGLYREVLYQRQAVTRRGRRHIRIANRLGELFAGREADVAREMAAHYEAAGDWQRAQAVAQLAGSHGDEAVETLPEYLDEFWTGT